MLVVSAVSGAHAQVQMSQPTPAPAAQAPQGDQPLVQAAPAYRGLFGAGSPARRGGHLLDLTASIYGEYGETRQGTTLDGSPLLDAGWFTAVRGGLAYEKAGQRTRFGLRGEGSFRYYQNSRESTLPRYRVEMGIDAPADRHRLSAVTFGATVDYEPYYVLPLFASSAPVTGGTAIVPTSRDDLLYRDTRTLFSETFSYERRLSTRSYVNLFEESRFTYAQSATADVRTVRAGGRYGYRFSPYTSLRLGYGYRTGRYGANTGQQLGEHDLDIGIDYRRPLTQSRRTTIGFVSGAALVDTQAARQWQVVGGANLRHEFLRGWFVQGDFVRNTQLIEGFVDPLFVNTATASLGGFAGRHVELLASSGYSRGVVALSSERYSALQGSGRIRIALARYLAIDTEGIVYKQDFDQQIALPSQFPPQVKRWSVRCNVALWLPLSR